MRRKTGPPAAIVELVVARSQGQCERCSQYLGDDSGEIHHRRNRGAGSAGRHWPSINKPQNLGRLCSACHHWVEMNPNGARVTGWRISGWNADPADVALVKTDGTRWLFGEDGGARQVGWPGLEDEPFSW